MASLAPTVACSAAASLVALGLFAATGGATQAAPVTLQAWLTTIGHSTHGSDSRDSGEPRALQRAVRPGGSHRAMGTPLPRVLRSVWRADRFPPVAGWDGQVEPVHLTAESAGSEAQSVFVRPAATLDGPLCPRPFSSGSEPPRSIRARDPHSGVGPFGSARRV